MSYTNFVLTSYRPSSTFVTLTYFWVNALSQNSFPDFSLSTWVEFIYSENDFNIKTDVDIRWENSGQGNCIRNQKQ